MKKKLIILLTISLTLLASKPALAVLRAIGDNVSICPNVSCTYGSYPAAPANGNLIIENQLGIGKVPAVAVDVSGATTTTLNISSGGTLNFVTSGHVISSINANDIKIASGTTASSISLKNSGGTTYGYIYSDAGGTGLLNPAGNWALRTDNSGNAEMYGNLTVPITSNPGVKVGNGSTGYMKIGSSGWYDDGTYLIPSGARNIYIRNSIPNTFLYSLANYIGDNSSANSALFRNTDLVGSTWSITHAGLFTQWATTYINNGGSPASVTVAGTTGTLPGMIRFTRNIGAVPCFELGINASTTFEIRWGNNCSTASKFTESSTGDMKVFGNIQGQGTTNGWYTMYEPGTLDGWFHFMLDTSRTTFKNVAVGPFFAANAVRYDLAEVTPVDPSEDLVLGEIVTTDPTHSVRLHRSQDKYQSDIIGVVSNVWTASMTIGGDTGPEKLDSSPDRRPIALAGRVTTLVNLESGPIKTGDSITSSSTAGTGMKASNAGVVVSKAMEDFDGTKVNSVGVEDILTKLRKQLKEGTWTDAEKASLEKTIGRLTSPLPKGTGRIISFINVHDYDPDTKIANLDDYKLKDDTLTNSKGNLITRLGAFSQTVVGKMVANTVITGKLLIDGTDLYQKLDEQQQRIDTLKSEIQSLQAKQN